MTIVQYAQNSWLISVKDNKTDKEIENYIDRDVTFEYNADTKCKQSKRKVYKM